MKCKPLMIYGKNMENKNTQFKYSKDFKYLKIKPNKYDVDSFNFKDDSFIALDNFLDDDLYEEIRNICFKYDDFKNTITCWPTPLYKDTYDSSDVIQENNILVSRVTFYLDRIAIEDEFLELMESDIKDKKLLKIFKVMKKYLNKLVELIEKTAPSDKQVDKNTLRVQIYKWPENSSIFWHDDGGWSYGFSYYLNEYWGPNWGGDLLVGTKHFLQTVKNRLAVVNGPMSHRVTPIQKGAPDRITLQAFTTYKK